MKPKEIVMTGLLGAVLMLAQVALSFLPNIELATLLIVLYALCFPRKVALGSIYVFVLLEGLIYGFGSWWFGYLYIWLVPFLLALLFRKNDSAVFWAVVNAAYGLFFGLFFSLTYAAIGGFWAGVSWWIAGIPFDIAHCVGNALSALFLYQPLKRCFDRLAKQFFTQNASSEKLS